MPSIHFLECSNKDCNFRARSSFGFPIFDEDAPEAVKKTPIPVPPRLRHFIIGTYGTSTCGKCGHEVADRDDETVVCPNCQAKDSALKNGSPCPKCGSPLEDDGNVAMF